MKSLIPALGLLSLLAFAGVSACDGGASKPPTIEVSSEQLKAGGVFIAHVVGCEKGCDQLQRGDIILEMDGQPVSSSKDMRVSRIATGNPIKLKVQKKGAPAPVEVELVLAIGLAKRKQDRFASIEELARAVAGLFDEYARSRPELLDLFRRGPLGEGGEDADHAPEAAAHVGDLEARHLGRAAARPLGAEDAGAGEVVDVVPGALRERPRLPVAGERADDELRIAGAELVVAEAEAGEDAGAELIEEHVVGADEAEERGHALGLLEVDDGAALCLVHADGNLDNGAVIHGVVIAGFLFGIHHFRLEHAGERHGGASCRGRPGRVNVRRTRGYIGRYLDTI